MPAAGPRFDWRGDAPAMLCGAAAALVPVAVIPFTFDPFALPKQLVLVICTTLAIMLCGLMRISVPANKVLLILVAAVSFAEIASLLAAPDRFGAITGVSGYRFGVVSHLAILAMFAFSVVSGQTRYGVRIVIISGVCGSLIVLVYALSQQVNLDPISWKTAGSERIFSTTGNANDLAALCVLYLGFTSWISLTRSWWRVTATILWPLALIAVIAGTQSRSGIIGLGVALVLIPCAALLNRWPTRELRRVVAPMLLAVAVATVVVLSAGKSGALVQRFNDVAHGEGSDSVQIRVDIWRGTLATFAHFPVFGVGQDGLAYQFDRYRPDDLGWFFSEPSPAGMDPLVASPHSAPLEVAVTLGLAGLAAISGLVLWTCRRLWQVLRGPRSAEAPFVVAALAGYAVTAALNPLNLGTATVAVVLAGATIASGGRVAAAGRPNFRARPHSLAVFATGLALCGAVLIFGPLSLLADREAYRAVQSDASGDATGAVNHAERAASLLPLERGYRREEVVAAANLAFTDGSAASLADAQRRTERYLSDFPGLAADFLVLARLRQANHSAGVSEAIAAAREASPFGADTAVGIAAVIGGK